MLQMKDEAKDRYDELEMSSVVYSDDDEQQRSTGLFESPDARAVALDMPAENVLSPRHPAKKAAKAHHVVDHDPSPRESPRFQEDDVYDAEGKPRARSRLDSIDDDRFRVNGIVVDQEIPGGPKPNWHVVYQVLFQSSTPRGQQMALALLVMVSVSITVGTEKRAFPLDFPSKRMRLTLCVCMCACFSCIGQRKFDSVRCFRSLLAFVSSPGRNTR